MDRRRFVRVSMAVGMGFSALTLRGALALDDATPDATPQDVDLGPALIDPVPDTIELSSGVRLVDYYVGEHSEYPRVLGEFINDNAFPVSFTSIIMAVRDDEGNILNEAQLAPLFAVTMPGEQGQAFGGLATMQADEVAIERITFELPDPVGPSPVLGTFLTDEVSFELQEEDRASDSYSAQGVVRNTGSVNIDGAAVIGVFRNADGRYIGHTIDVVQSTIAPDQWAEVSLEMNGGTGISHSPFDYLRDGEDYSVEFTAFGNL